MSTDELRAMDIEIHREVMGAGCTFAPEACDPDWFDDEAPFIVVPRYAADMRAAWLVVERLTEGEYVKVRCGQSHYHGDYCTVVAAHESQRDASSLVKRDVIAEWGETMPVAICRAALKAVRA
jgi:hypothetical protein